MLHEIQFFKDGECLLVIQTGDMAIEDIETEKELLAIQEGCQPDQIEVRTERVQVAA